MAALLGAALALRPRRRGTPTRQPAVIQTQIILAIVGAVVMLVVGTNLARAFGVVGAAGLVRYRAKIEDPKDAGVMLSTLAIGLASGVGLYGLAAFSAAFILRRPLDHRVVRAEERKTVRAEDQDGRRDRREARRDRSDSPPLADRAPAALSSDAELCYDIGVPLEVERDRISNAILALDPEGHAAVEWSEKKKSQVKLIIQPDDGVEPVVAAIRKAKKTIDIVIFRFDRAEVEKALEAAVARGVVVHALIAHTNRGGEKNLRKLEMRLLEYGVTVARTADDLPRYHGKMMLIDGSMLHVYAFNYTKLDIDKSRSLGIVTRDRRLVQEAARLFEADTCRQPFSPGSSRFVVSPENSRERPHRVHQGREEAAPHLRPGDQRQVDPAGAGRSRARRRRRQNHRRASRGTCPTCRP